MMFTKLFQKSPQKSPHPPDQNVSQTNDTVKFLEPRVVVHYGIPSTASILAFDPIQYLLAIGTLDGRIKVIGGDNIECLLISSKPMPFKNLEFLQNQGFLVSVTNENVVQVWDLEHRRLSSNLQWESNISAFSVAYGTNYMYVGDEHGYLSVLKYDIEEGNIQHMPYHVPANLIAEEAGIPIPDYQSIVGLLPQPCSSGKRVLIAYANGVIILWDVSEDQAALVRGYKDLQVKDGILVDSSSVVRRESFSYESDEEQTEKEISSLCWVSSDGSILAVGYVDGDILLWNLSTSTSAKDQKTNKSSNDAIKLQLSSGDRRLPVIVLRWSANIAHNGRGGQLFVYGGDNIGSEEVLTILSLDWSSGLQALKCVNRVDLTLNGAYADILLVPNAGAAESSHTCTPLVLTNPGQLHFYDDDCLSALTSSPERKCAVNAVQYPVTVPTTEPRMTIAKLCLVQEDGDVPKLLKETVLAAKPQLACTTTTGGAKWPVTGGFSSQLPFADNNGVERMYIAGYQDGYVRIWDATFPVLSLIFVLGSEVKGIEVPGANKPITALDFSSTASSLAFGNECGLVHLLRLVGDSDETKVHVVTENKREEINLNHGNGWQSTALFSLLNSPVRTLQYIVSGARLAIGYECGRVAVIDVRSSSVLFLTDSLVSSSSPVIFLAEETYSEARTDYPEHYETISSNDPVKHISFILTKDSHVVVVDNSSGTKICSQPVNSKEDPTATSIYILDGNFSVPDVSEKKSLNSTQDSGDGKEPEQSNNQLESDLAEDKVNTSCQLTQSWQHFMDSLILICCKDSILLTTSKSMIQGETNFIREINLEKQCCWTAIFKRNGQQTGVILVYVTGVIEVRSLPDLKVLGETSIMSILWWNFKTNMELTISSSSNGQITMVNGCEFAIISLFDFENDFRIPEALPRLHDKVVAAAAEAAFNFSKSQKSKQTTTTGILGGIIKGIKGGKGDEDVDLEETREVLVAKLDAMFSRFPFSVSDLDLGDDFDMAINIDEVEDEPEPLPSLSIKSKTESKSKETERERLFEGGSTNPEPKLRTAEEIKAKYRKTGDASAAALEAKDKLLERQQKLEKLRENTEELASGSENFASMASELAKRMENRKWWQL